MDRTNKIKKILNIIHVSISTADPSSMNLMDSLEQQLMKDADMSFLKPSFILMMTRLSSLLPGISSSAVLKSMKASLVSPSERAAFARVTSAAAHEGLESSTLQPIRCQYCMSLANQRPVLYAISQS